MKVRICFSKTEAGRYLSHLDIARTMERGLRRAKAPLAFSEGFNPHPKISFASALAVGVTGCREYIDVELAYRVDIGSFGRALESAFPAALAFVAALEIGPGTRSLSSAINLAVYRISARLSAGDEEKAAAGVAGVLAAGELWRKPKLKPGKKPIPAKEVRGLVRRIEIVEEAGAAWAGAGGLNADSAGAIAVGAGSDGASSGGAGSGGAGRIVAIEAELGMTAGGQLQPRELWEMICAAGGFEAAAPPAICRTALLIRQDGKTFSPMEGVAV
ncbi:MAG: TIGR03936 family radical SAM-associated protein [Clostridiales bacterium]|nr:TIGR03936 family radical SAM-associated protein [Clostridiales bacterium]